ncbi:MAG: NAD-dependent deacylase [Planctomycetes bacterium]|nr:NAD-dependent deacylase [Planctomycetota bacterium]
MDEAAVEQAAQLLASTSSLCISTGAGMSAESGIDTFRDESGLWTKVKPEEFATPQAFQRDPVKVWEWYRWRRRELAKVEPHDGHRVLADWEERVSDFTLVTKNVDGLHHRAGSTKVIELHGRLDVVRCTGCKYEVIGLDDLGADPHCPECSQRLRPGVVWFGEALPPGALDAAFFAAQRCDTMVVVGTSGVVQPAASLVDAAKAHGAYVIEVNPNPTELSYLADVCLRGGCQRTLPALDAAWRRLAS